MKKCARCKKLKEKKMILPKITYVNYKKAFPMITDGCFKKLFYFNRFWGGKLWNIGCKRYAIVLDFRGNWTKDMITGQIN